MASKAEVFIPVHTYTGFADSLKVRVTLIGQSVRRWAQQGQLGSLASTDIGRHTGARI